MSGRAQRRLSRRQLLGELALGGGALLLAGCGAPAGISPAIDGSTLRSTYRDRGDDGELEVGAGAPLIDRPDLAPAALPGSVLATLAHLSDAHVLDGQSPARVPFLRRLGAPFNSTFRPQEALTARVMQGALRSIEAFAPDALIQGGDLIDNAQSNELEQALALLRGGAVRPDSGAPGYRGVQSAQDPDPFYYRPDIDAPRHPGLLEAATSAFRSRGLRTPCYPVLGDHDLLVQGVIPASGLTQEIAVGSRAVWDLPSSLRLAPGLLGSAGSAGLSPDAFVAPGSIEALIEQLSAVPSVDVAADGSRRELGASELLSRLRAGSPAGAATGSEALLDYSFDVGASVRVIVLDLVRREGGSGGLVHPAQEAWLANELDRARGRWLLVFSHQPLLSAANGERLLALLDGEQRMLAAICGHTHRNQITPRATAAGGYWLIYTCSLIDYPQEARALRVRERAGGGVVLETWMLDHAPDGGLGDISRELAYLDAQGGRPQGFAGGPLDRNVRLYRR